LESKNNKVKSLFLNHWSEESCLKEIIRNIEEFSPSIIGFQVLTSTRVSVYHAIDYIHKNYPKIKILLGGIHATVMHEQLIKKYPFAIAILGEGERTMQELTEEMFKEKPNLKKIDGIAFFEKGKPTRTKRRELIRDLDSLPFPNHEQYFKNKKRISACVLTSRGCPNACSFCCLNPENKRMVRFRSVKNVVDEIEYISNKFPSITDIFIFDDTFLLNNKRVIEICDEIIKRGIKKKFTCTARMKPISQEMVYKLEEAGFKDILLGLESGDNGILEKCHKGINQDDVIKAFKLFSKTSLNPKTFLIIGLPGENINTIKETARFVKKIQKIRYFSHPNKFNFLTIYPGAEVYEIAKQKGFINDDYWLSEKETPIYTAENSYKELQRFEEILANNLSYHKLKTIKGFLAQIDMIPYIINYAFRKRKLLFKAIKQFIKS